MTISLKDCVKLTGIVIVCFAQFSFALFFEFLLRRITASRQRNCRNVTAVRRANCNRSNVLRRNRRSFDVDFRNYVDILRQIIRRHSCERTRNSKALGYSNRRLAMDFVIFGVSVFIGCALGFGCGYASAPFIYEQLTIEGMSVNVNFHVELLFALVIAPTVVFSALSALIASVALRRPALDIIRGIKKIKISKTKSHNNKNEHSSSRWRLKP